MFKKTDFKGVNSGWKILLVSFSFFLLLINSAFADAPEIIMGFPTNNSINASNNMNFSFTFTDDSAVGSSNVTLWSNFTGTLSANESITGFLNNIETTILVSDLPDGTYVWFWNSTDDAGNKNMTQTSDGTVLNFTLTIDTTPPDIVIEYPLNGSLNNTDDIYIGFEVNDSLSGILNATLFTNLSGSYAFSGANQTVISNNTLEQFYLEDVEDGIYGYYINVSDVLGNWQNSGIETFTVDTGAIKIDSLYPLNNTIYFNNTVIELNFTANNTASGCWYQLDKNGANSTIPNCANGVNITVIGNGLHNLTLWINDSANNTAENITYFTISCTESWSYSSWGSCSCSTSTQTRTANDLNSCGTTENRSSLSQSCDPTGCSDDSDGGGTFTSGTGSATYNYELSIIVDSYPVSVEIEPGKSRRTSVKIKNTGNRTLQDVETELSGVDWSDWYEVDPISKDNLLEDDRQTFSFDITVPNGTAIGSYTITIKASADNADEEIQTFDLKVVPSDENVAGINDSIILLGTNITQSKKDLDSLFRSMNNTNLTSASDKLKQAEDLLNETKEAINEGDYFNAFQKQQELKSLLSEIETIIKAEQARMPQGMFSRISAKAISVVPGGGAGIFAIFLGAIAAVFFYSGIIPKGAGGYSPEEGFRFGGKEKEESLAERIKKLKERLLKKLRRESEVQRNLGYNFQRNRTWS